MKTKRELKDGAGKRFEVEIEVAEEGSQRFERMVVALAIKARGNKNKTAAVADGFIKVSIREIG